MRCTRVPAARGEITDRHGEPPRRRRPGATGWRRCRRWCGPTTCPGLPPSPRGRSSGLRRLLHRHRSSLDLTVASLPTAAGRRVREARLPGVFVVPDTHRRYPQRRLCSGPCSGWTGVATPVEMKRWPDLPLGAVVGRAGLEQVYDPILRGTDGRQCVYVTPAGTPVALGPYTAPRRGSTVRLTLDLGLQRRLTGALATVLRGVPGQPRGDLGGAVVLDPRNGQVLAMASLPSYDSRVFGPPGAQPGAGPAGTPPGEPDARARDAGGGPARVDLQARRRRGEHAARAGLAVPGAARRRCLDAGQPHLPQLDDPAGAEPAAGDRVVQRRVLLPARLGAGPGADHPHGPQPGRRPADRHRPARGDRRVPRHARIGRPGPAARGTPAPRSSSASVRATSPSTPLQDALWTAGVATGATVTPHLGLAYGQGAGPSTRLPWPRAAPARLRRQARAGPGRHGTGRDVRHRQHPDRAAGHGGRQDRAPRRTRRPPTGRRTRGSPPPPRSGTRAWWRRRSCAAAATG